MGLEGKLESWLWRKENRRGESENLPEDTGRESEVPLPGPREGEMIASFIWEGVSVWILKALRWAFLALRTHIKNSSSQVSSL